MKNVLVKMYESVFALPAPEQAAKRVTDAAAREHAEFEARMAGALGVGEQDLRAMRSTEWIKTRKKLFHAMRHLEEVESGVAMLRKRCAALDPGADVEAPLPGIIGA